MITLVGFLLSACHATPPLPIVAPAAPVSVPNPSPLSLGRVQWTALSPTQMRTQAEEAIRSGKAELVFLLDANGHETLTLNLIEMRRFIEEQQAVVAYLRRILDERSASVIPASTPRDPETPTR
jgi:hypothetical protein